MQVIPQHLILFLRCEVSIRKVALFSNTPAVVFFIEKLPIENRKLFVIDDIAR